MGLEPASSHDDGPDPTTPVLAAVAPQRWAPSFFGVVPRGSVRRRPSDALHLLAALGVVLGCIVVTDGFAAHDDSLYAWLGDLPEWLAAARDGALPGLHRRGRGRDGPRPGADPQPQVGHGPRRGGRGRRGHGDHVRRGDGPGRGAPCLRRRPLAARRGDRLVDGRHRGAARGRALPGPSGPAVRPRPSRAWRCSGPCWPPSAPCPRSWPPSASAGPSPPPPAWSSGPRGRPPTLSSVRRTLDDLGIAIDHLDIAERQTLGETRFVGRAPDGAPASVVVIGRDAADARLLSKLGRAVVFHDAGPSVSVTRSAQLEHRAYLLLMAAKAGVPVSEVVTTATGGTEDLALLALLEPGGRAPVGPRRRRGPGPDPRRRVAEPRSAPRRPPLPRSSGGRQRPGPRRRLHRAGRLLPRIDRCPAGTLCPRPGRPAGLQRHHRGRRARPRRRPPLHRPRRA